MKVADLNLLSQRLRLPEGYPFSVTRLIPYASVRCHQCFHNDIGHTDTIPGCRKGSRECHYPEQTVTSKSHASSKSTQQQTTDQDSESSSDESDDVDGEMFPQFESEEDASKPKKDLVPPDPSQVSRKGRRLTVGHEANGRSNLKRDKSLSLSTDEPRLRKARSRSVTFASPGPASASPGASPLLEAFSHTRLTKDVQFYLDHHQKNITFHHYIMRPLAPGFVHSTLIEAALAFEPLLYAVVAFTAYHYSVAQPNGRISDFLGYYNKSLQTLRRSLQSNEAHSDATVLAVLQLAALEVILRLSSNTRKAHS